jgi:hypothetical protein
MSRLIQQPSVEVSATIKLTEPELRALEALTSYGDEIFLEVFYARLGKSCLRPHEAGIRSLFAMIRTDLAPILRRATAAKTAFTMKDPVIRSREQYDHLISQIPTKQGVTDAW